MAIDGRLYLAGEWVEGAGDEGYQVVSPATGDVIAEAAFASAEQIDHAVAAARAAQDEFRFWSAFERADLCHRVAAAIEGMVPEIARIQTLE